MSTITEIIRDLEAYEKYPVGLAAVGVCVFFHLDLPE